MKHEEILERISPCGISCEGCFAYKSGDIKKYSNLLSEHLGKFENYSGRFSELLEEPVLNVYPYFKLQLDYFNQTECTGCRHEQCKLLKSCKVRACSEEKGVDFCFQCSKFPCNETGFDENLELRWKKNNARMRDIGVEAYYNEVKDNLRYP